MQLSFIQWIIHTVNDIKYKEKEHGLAHAHTKKIALQTLGENCVPRMSVRCNATEQKKKEKRE